MINNSHHLAYIAQALLNSIVGFTFCSIYCDAALWREVFHKPPYFCGFAEYLCLIIDIFPLWLSCTFFSVFQICAFPPLSDKLLKLSLIDQVVLGMQL